MAGTGRNLALAEYVRDRFREYGLDEVSFHEFPALLSFPKSAALSIRSPVEQAFDLREDSDTGRQGLEALRRPGAGRLPRLCAVRKSPRGGRLRERRQPGGFPAARPHGHRPQGQDRAHAVLESLFVPRLQGLRGRAARRRGHDHLLGSGGGRQPDGHRSIPKGPWGPDSHIQWGAILYDWLGQGEPFTFHWKQQAGRQLDGRAGARQAAAEDSVDAAQRAQCRRNPEAPGRRQGTGRLAGRPADHLSHRAGPGDARDGRAERRARHARCAASSA